MYTYYVVVNVTLSIDDQLVERARKRAEALGNEVKRGVPTGWLQLPVGTNERLGESADVGVHQ